MENWLIPITLIPGVGLLVLSTSNLLVALTRNISDLMESDASESIIRIKLSQLGLLSRSMTFFYLSVALLTLASVAGGALKDQQNYNWIPTALTIAGILFLFLPMVLLIIYAMRAVGIRKQQLEEKLKKERG